MLQLIPGFPATNRTAVNLKTERQFIMTTAPANTSRSILAMLDVEQFVQIKDGQVVTNSLKVAEAFGKKHFHVMRDIKAVDCSEEFNASNFGCVDYIDGKGEVRPMYEMTKNGFIFLVMGFTGAKAAAIKEAYIRVFDEMAAAWKMNALNAWRARSCWVISPARAWRLILDVAKCLPSIATAATCG